MKINFPTFLDDSGWRHVPLICDVNQFSQLDGSDYEIISKRFVGARAGQTCRLLSEYRIFALPTLYEKHKDEQAKQNED